MKDFWAEEFQNQRKEKLRKVAILVVILLIIVLIFALIGIYFYNLEFRTWCDENILRKEILQENTKSIEIDRDENTQVFAYDKYICILRKKKLEYYNKMGNKIAEIELDINKAIFTSSGRYMAICEEKGQKFYLICGKEKIFENEVDGNINQIKVSKTGNTYVVLSNNMHKSIVDVFSRSGEEIFKTNLASSRAVDIAISQDSKYLAIAEVDLSGILISSKVQIISMDLAQQKPSQAIIYSKVSDIDRLIMNIEYQAQNRLICMYNDGIDIIQENKENKLIEFKDRKISFVTVELNDRISLIEEVSSGKYSSDTKVCIINPETMKQREYCTKDIVKNIYTSENKIVINIGTELHIISKNGILIKKYISDTEINNIVMTEGMVGVVYKDKVQIINI